MPRKEAVAEEEQGEWEWPKSAHAVALLDAAMRCPVCTNVCVWPVALPCSHAFCGACIRNALGVREACPVCGKKAGTGDMQPNRALERVLHAFRDARPLILAAVRAQAAPPAAARRSAAASNSIDATSDAGPVERVRGRWRRRSAPVVHEDVTDAHDAADHTTAQLSGIASTSNDQTESAEEPAVVSARQRLLMSVHARDGTVGTRTKLPLKSYAKTVFPDAALRTELANWGLPRTGDRDALRWRHHTYTVMFNSAADSERGAVASEVRDMVIQAERQRTEDQSAARSVLRAMPVMLSIDRSVSAPAAVAAVAPIGMAADVMDLTDSQGVHSVPQMPRVAAAAPSAPPPMTGPDRGPMVVVTAEMQRTFVELARQLRERERQRKARAQEVAPTLPPGGPTPPHDARPSRATAEPENDEAARASTPEVQAPSADEPSNSQATPRKRARLQPPHEIQAIQVSQ